MIPEIVRRAMVDTVTDIGQITNGDMRELNRAVKRGWLSKGKGGPFPNLKTVYAVPGFDFDLDRQRQVDEILKGCAP